MSYSNGLRAFRQGFSHGVLDAGEVAFSISSATSLVLSITSTGGPGCLPCGSQALRDHGLERCGQGRPAWSAHLDQVNDRMRLSAW